MKIYVINMERSIQRRKSMEDHLRHLGLAFEIVKAVDGSLMKEEYPQTTIEGDYPFGRSEIGCMLSHCKIYALMQERDDDFALVLEDDVVLTDPGMAQVLAALDIVASKDTVTLLTYFGDRNEQVTLHKIRNKTVIKGKKGDYAICQPSAARELTRAGAYVVSKATAKRMLDFQTPSMRCRADQWEVYDRESVISGLQCLFPMPVTENYEHGSEINYSRNSFEAFTKKMISWIIYNNIPVLAYLLKKRRQQYSGMYKNIVLEKRDQQP
jgi:glycosyl transferase family 25